MDQNLAFLSAGPRLAKQSWPGGLGGCKGNACRAFAAFVISDRNCGGWYTRVAGVSQTQAGGNQAAVMILILKRRLVTLAM